MQRLEISCAVRPIYGSLGAEGLKDEAQTASFKAPVHTAL
jgi:hypothetical protein